MKKPKELIEELMEECEVTEQEVHFGEFNERLKLFFSRLFESSYLTTMSNIRDNRMTTIKKNMTLVKNKVERDW